MMKKVYIQPSMKVLEVRAAQMLCTSDPVFGRIYDDDKDAIYDVE